MKALLQAIARRVRRWIKRMKAYAAEVLGMEWINGRLVVAGYQ